MNTIYNDNWYFLRLNSIISELLSDYYAFPAVQSKSKVALNEFLFPSAGAIVFKSANQTLADLANTRIQQPLIPEASLWAKLQNVCSFNLYTFFSPLVVIFRFGVFSWA